jgi:hypothetical protein
VSSAADRVPATGPVPPASPKTPGPATQTSALPKAKGAPSPSGAAGALLLSLFGVAVIGGGVAYAASRAKKRRKKAA